MPCSTCGSVSRLQNALLESEKSSSWVSLARISVGQFSWECSEGSACEVCSTTDVRIREINNTRVTVLHELEILARVDSGVQRVWYRIPHSGSDVAVEWVVYAVSVEWIVLRDSGMSRNDMPILLTSN